jgi:hypothetical protein
MKDDVRFSRPSGGSEVLCFKSWTAYVRPTVIATVAIAIAVIAFLPLKSITPIFAVVVAVLGVYAATVQSLRQEMLMIDEEGVWYCRGGPDTKPRMVGVRWSYVRCSVSKPRIGWPQTSRTVVIRNRFTGREILVRHMAGGDRAVACINSLQRVHPRNARCSLETLRQMASVSIPRKPPRKIELDRGAKNPTLE